jgi:hypothetical protein
MKDRAELRVVRIGRGRPELEAPDLRGDAICGYPESESIAPGAYQSPSKFFSGCQSETKRFAVSGTSDALSALSPSREVSPIDQILPELQATARGSRFRAAQRASLIAPYRAGTEAP